MLAALVGLGLTLPMSNASLSDVETQKLGFSPVRLAALRKRMASFVTEGRLHGIVILIERHGKVVSLEAFGTRVAGGSEPMRTDAIFRVASMTKPVTAVASAILVERGMLRFSDTVSQYLPRFGTLKKPDGSEPNRPILLRQLLSHSSGINSETPIEDSDRASLTLAQFVEIIEKQPLRAEPGTETRYSGPGISVAGRIVEIVSKAPFDKFCEDEIFRPLEMRDTAFFIDDAKASRLAGVSRRDNGKLFPLQDPLGSKSVFVNPAGGLLSTAKDFALFQRDMLKKQPRLLSREMIRLMTTPTPKLPGGNDEMGYGVGWSIARGPGPVRGLLPPGAFGHTGALGTYSWSDPANDLVGVFMTQTTAGIDPELDIFRTMVYASLLDNEIPAGKR